MVIRNYVDEYRIIHDIEAEDELDELADMVDVNCVMLGLNLRKIIYKDTYYLDVYDNEGSYFISMAYSKQSQEVTYHRDSDNKGTFKNIKTTLEYFKEIMSE